MIFIIYLIGCVVAYLMLADIFKGREGVNAYLIVKSLNSWLMVIVAIALKRKIKRELGRPAKW